MPSNPVEDPRLIPAVDLLGRTGAAEFQIRYCDEEEPAVWFALARWGDHWNVMSAFNPLAAIFRLCDDTIDGGQCQHCFKPTGFTPDIESMPLDKIFCWYQWDPELKTFRRGCE
jgi:hypothetical protein